MAERPDSSGEARAEAEGSSVGAAKWAAMKELERMHPGITVEQVIAATGWPLKVASKLDATAEPTPNELSILRDLNERTARAHAGQA